MDCDKCFEHFFLLLQQESFRFEGFARIIGGFLGIHEFLIVLCKISFVCGYIYIFFSEKYPRLSSKSQKSL